MKKIALLIGIMSLAVATLADSRTKLTDNHAATVIKTSLSDSFQKSKGDELTENFSQTYPISPNGRVNIANINGDVHVNVWDQNSVKVDAVKRAYSQQRLTEVTIDVQSAPDSVQIKTQYPEDRTYNGRNREDSWASVEYTLTMPRRARLDGAELVNGSLDIEGVEGDVRASLVNGTVKAAGLGGDVKLNTVNGGIEANVATLGTAKSVQLNSVNGPIVLMVPSGASADVKATTVHGGITNDFGLPVEDGQYVGHSMSGQIGSGGARIRLNNVNGSIAVKRGAAM
ncbi:MAG TPA: DUF4097 family beta strand repeat-containing protein [Pyrinomonadaceae bacterium]|nr:DUF4097 family beta strand repeat-containing protein [Pyrinomonadaceae bacterium]